MLLYQHVLLGLTILLVYLAVGFMFVVGFLLGDLKDPTSKGCECNQDSDSEVVIDKMTLFAVLLWPLVVLAFLIGYYGMALNRLISDWVRKPKATKECKSANPCAKCQAMKGS